MFSWREFRPLRWPSSQAANRPPPHPGARGNVPWRVANASSPYAPPMLLNPRAGFAAGVAAMLVLAACSSVTSPASSEPLSIQVFMKVHADPTDAARVASVLRHSSEVRRVTYLNHEGAYREFSCLFRDQPELIA